MISLNGITLPNGLIDTSEFSKQKVSQTVQRTLAGAVVVYTGQRTNGFPIVLSSGSDYGWLQRSVVEQLAALADQSGAIFSLSYKDTNYQVLFDHSNGNAFEAIPVMPFSNPSPTAYYRVVIKLLTI